ncbi:MAG: 50S ribosomal protein L18e [Methanosarcinales archaeon]|nr:MAG: 50S ribosomal protein L18e [Methanosarcinales archaeon]
MRKTKTNPRLAKLIGMLKVRSRDENAPIWRSVAKKLERPTRHYADVNISKINRHTSKDETVLVPGKVLGAGVLDHPVTVAALSFSSSARDKIASAKGKCTLIEKLIEENPSGKGIRIIQ